MAFPVDKLDLKGEIFVNNAWTDISEYVYGDGNNAFVINRGYSDEQKSTRASTCNFKLSSPEGLFNNRNPLSPYYGLIPRNTPFRVTAGTSDSYLQVDPIDYESHALCPVESAFDILGDIDVALDIEPTSFSTDRERTLAGKYEITGDQRSWVFTLNGTGHLAFYWSTAGTLATRSVKTSTLPLPTSDARISVRAFLDVNNGAGGHDVKFYYSTAGITGPWTQLGTTITTAGVTSIYDSFSAQVIGGLASYQTLGGSSTNFSGRIYKFLLKNSAGTTVSSLDFTTAQPGEILVTDAQGNIFLLQNSARIRNDSIRFTGEISKFPYEADNTNLEVYSNITASGIIRRLTQGVSPLRSPIYRKFNSFSPTGYFSMEDLAGSTVLGNDAPNGQPGTVFNISFGEDTTLPGTSGAMTIEDQTAVVTGNCVTTAATTYASTVWFSKMASVPVSDTLLIRFFAASGAVRRWDVYAGLTVYTIIGYNSVGAQVTVDALPYAGLGLPTSWTAFNLELTTSGGNVDWVVNAITVGDSIAWTTGTSTYAGATGRFTGFEIRAQTNLVDTSFAHVLMTQTQLPFIDESFYAAATGYQGETAGFRIQRLSEEEGINLLYSGNLLDTEAMGTQLADTFMNLIEQAKNVDDGLLVEPQDQIGIEYITRASLLNKLSTVSLDMASGHLSGEFLPIDDDLRSRNDVTITRENGSSARVEQTEGPNTPALIGRYQEGATLNAAYDTQLQYIAGWKVFLGTWDEPRYEQIQVQLARPQFVASTTLSNSIKKTNIAEMGTITGIPIYQFADDVKFLILGYEERLGQFQWDIKWNATPYGPYEPNSLISTRTEYRADATDSKIVSGVNSTATSLSVTATADPVWITSTTPYDIRIGGEVMTVTAVSGSSFPQTFTVTRSVNGVVKSHLANAPVLLAQPFYTAL